MENVPVSDELESSAASPEDAGKRADTSSPEAEESRAAQTAAADDSSQPQEDAAGTGAVPSDNASRQSAEVAAGASAEAEDSGENAGPEQAAQVEQNEQAAADADDDDESEYEDENASAEPLELIEEAPEEEEIKTDWYILKVQVNRESTICDALWRRVKMAGLERYFNKIIVPTEEVQEFTKTGKKRIVKRKLYPGYIMVNMAINDDSWFLVRETPGIGDFTGSAGKPTPMQSHEIAAILQKTEPDEEGEAAPKIGIKVKPGDRVRVKEGYFQNFEGDVEAIDEANGRVTVIINIFNRSTPVELEHWQVEEV